MTTVGSHTPHLSRSSRILPSASGWTIQSGSEIVAVRSRRLARAGETLLDLFDGSHSLRAISKESGVSVPELERLVTRLSRLNLLESGHLAGSRSSRRRPYFRTRSPSTPANSIHHPLLLVGLGDLGLTVLDQLLGYGLSAIYIFDAVPVQTIDLAPFYQPGDLGRLKADIVWRCLSKAGQAAVHRVRAGAGDRDALRETLAEAIGNVEGVLCCVDRPSQLAEWLSPLCAAAGVPLIVAELSDAGGSVGPIRTSDGTTESGGCIGCASLYRTEGDRFSLLTREYLQEHFPLSARWRPSPEPWLIKTIARLALMAVFQTDDRATAPGASRSQLWQLSSQPHEIVATAVPKHYACSQCFPVSDRTSEALRKQVSRDWQRHWNRPATGPVDLLELRCRLQPFIGERFAMFRSCHQESPDQRRAVYRFCRERGANPRDNLLANAFRAVVERPGSPDNRAAAYSEGADLQDGRKAEALALIEGIERLFALEKSDPRCLVTASYRTVFRHALDPMEFPLYAEQQYTRRGFGLRKFDPGQTIEWVWGVRVSDSEPILVPYDLVFRRHDGPRLYRANSNGAACHSSFHHAVLGGIYETVERDSLMTVWMNRMSLPVLRSPAVCADTLGFRRDLQALSLELTCVDITTDLQIPVVLGVLTDKLNPDLLLLDPVSSLFSERLHAKLDRELTQFCRPYLSNPRCFTNRATASADPASVKNLPDHLAFYQHREKIGHARFLTSGSKSKDAMRHAAAEPMDVKEELGMVVDRLAQRGYKVIVVDCTAPLIRDLGLHAVKVLIPGLQPLHAGHGYAPLGGRRLYQVPRLMGLARRDKTRADLNPWPHPFW